MQHHSISYWLRLSVVIYLIRKMWADWLYLISLNRVVFFSSELPIKYKFCQSGVGNGRWKKFGILRMSPVVAVMHRSTLYLVEQIKFRRGYWICHFWYSRLKNKGLFSVTVIIRLHCMHSMQSIVISESVPWFVSQSVSCFFTNVFFREFSSKTRPSAPLKIIVKLTRQTRLNGRLVVDNC